PFLPRIVRQLKAESTCLLLGVVGLGHDLSLGVHFVNVSDLVLSLHTLYDLFGISLPLIGDDKTAIFGEPNAEK
ncbi:hypothetical protein LINPERHAP1_LOCUS18906, partial [Linum perenne]